MKKFNGTDYDSLLPLAYNALNSQQLDGKTFNEIQNLFSYIASGSYVGTGTYGQNNPTTINCGFKPKGIFIAQEEVLYPKNVYVSKNGGDKFYTSTSFNPLFPAHYTDSYDKIFYTQFEFIPFASEKDIFLEYIGNSHGLGAGTAAVLAYTTTNIGVSFYSDVYQWQSYSDNFTEEDFRNASGQYNSNGINYYYIAIG